MEHDERGGLALILPDYPGNQMFNTLGLLRHPQGGLAFIDFENGRLLHVAIQAHVMAPLEPVRSRELRGRWRPNALPFSWSASEAVPQAPAG